MKVMFLKVNYFESKVRKFESKVIYFESKKKARLLNLASKLILLVFFEFTASFNYSKTVLSISHKFEECIVCLRIPYFVVVNYFLQHFKGFLKAC